MAKSKLTEKDKKNMIITDLGNKLYDYNNDYGGFSEEGVKSFISGNNNPIVNTTDPGNMGGVSTTSSFYDYTPSKYDKDIYAHDLENLDNIRSANQGSLDALGRSAANFIGKTAVNVIGGLTGAVYSAGSALINQDWGKFLDNDYVQALDESSDAIGDYFKVYKNSDYDEKFVLSKLVSNPIMFADEFMDTLSFTAGAVVTELASQGLASGLVASRALNYFNKMNSGRKALGYGAEAAEALEGLASASKASRVFGNIDKGAKLTRQLATGAFWEASVEARQLGKEMRTNMVNDYLSDLESQGIDISNMSEENLPEAVQKDIDDRITKASAATLGLNMGLVGWSNISQFPTIFKSSNMLAKGVERDAVSNILQQEGKYISKFANQTRAESLLRKTWGAVKNPFMEGVVEEGGQGIISKTFGSFYDRKNDIESIGEADKFLQSFSKAFTDTYTTVEGLNEVVMGALVGGVGSPGAGILSVLGKDNSIGKLGYNISEDAEGNKTYTPKTMWDGGVASGIREVNEAEVEANSLANQLNSQPNLLKSMQAHYDSLVRSKSINDDIDAAVENNDNFSFENAKDDMLFNYLDTRVKLGLTDDVKDKLSTLKSMSDNEFYRAFNGEEALATATDSDKEVFKRIMTDRVESNLDSVISARNIAEGLGVTKPYLNSPEIQQEMVYTISKASFVDNRLKSMNSMLNKYSNNLASLNNNNPNSLTTNDYISELNANLKELGNSELSDKLNSERVALLDIIHRVNDGESLPIETVKGLLTYKQNSPADYDLNKESIDTILNDSIKAIKFRNDLITMYNDLATRKGAEKFQKFLNDLDEARVKAIDKQNKDVINEATRRETELEEVANETSAMDRFRAKIKTFNESGSLESAEDLLGFANEVSPEDLEDSDIDSLMSAEAIVNTPIADEVDGEVTPIEPINNNSSEDVEEEVVEANILDETMSEITSQEYLKESYELLIEGKSDLEELIEFYNLYRSQPNVADKGTEKDYEDFNIFYNNNRGDINSEDTIIEELPLDEEEISNDVNEAEGIDIIDVENSTDTTIEDTIIIKHQADLNSTNTDGTGDSLEGDVKDVNEGLEFLQENYLGTSLTNIHIEKNWVSGKAIDKRNEDGKLILLPTYPISALDPNLAEVNTDLHVRVATEDEYVEYTQKDDYSTVINNSETLPLVSKQDGNFLGFILTPKGASSKTNNLESGLLKRLKAFREEVFNNQDRTYLLNVIDKSTGLVSYRKDDTGKPIFRPIKEHMSVDGTKLSQGVEIALDIQGQLFNQYGVPTDANVVNTRMQSGHIYMLIPTANGDYFKTSAKLSRINSTDANTVYKMLQMFIANPKNPGDTGIIGERRNLQSLGIDFGNMRQFYDALKTILHIKTSGPNNFFKRENIDGIYTITLTSPTGASLSINQLELASNDTNKQELIDFISNNFYRGINIARMNNNEYFHPVIVDNKLSIERYPNYENYLFNSDHILTDVYGTHNDPLSNRLDYVTAPFIKVSYPQINDYKYLDSTTSSDDSVGIVEESSNIQTFKGSYIDEDMLDDMDMNFSMTNLENDTNQIISPDLDNEIDNFINFCK